MQGVSYCVISTHFVVHHEAPIRITKGYVMLVYRNSTVICLIHSLLTTGSGEAVLAIFFSMMLREAKKDLTEGTYVRFRTDCECLQSP